MLKNFTKPVFNIATAVFAVFTFVTLVAAAAVDEGTSGGDNLTEVLAKLFYVFRFPTHTILLPLISLGGAFAFFAGLLVNCLFYALLMERLYSFLVERKE